MNPIVGILFLIYLYDTIKDVPTLIKDTKMKAMNPIPQTQLEESIIRDKVPIVHSGQHNQVTFQPYMSENMNMSEL